MKKCRFGIIGLGHMGKAILDGLDSVAFLEPKTVGLYTLDKDTLEFYKDKGYTIFENEKDLALNTEIVLIAIKPQDMDNLIETIKDCNINTLVSIAVGISINYFKNHFNCPVIRLMPNMPLQLRNGATALSHSIDVSENDLNLVLDLFKVLGTCHIIDESLMNDIVIVNGSTPAYVYYYIDCMLKDAISRGIDENIAKDMLIETFIGSAKMLRENTASIESQINAVCSKGGTTIEAITTLKENKLDEIIKQANTNCINRAKVLGK